MFIVGCLMYFKSSYFNNDNSFKQEKGKEKITKFKEKRCVDNVCINSVVITCKDGHCYITGTIINTTSTDIPGEILKLNFELDDGREINHYYQYSLLKSNEESSFEIVLTIDYVVSAIDYSIEKLTEEQLNEYNNSDE